MNLIYRCFQHENLARYICLDNGCTQKLLCEQCIKKQKGINRGQDIMNKTHHQMIQQHVQFIYYTTHYQTPVKIENFCENLLYICEENTQIRDNWQLNKNSIIKSMEGKDQYQKLQIFKQMMEQKKSFMEEKYVKQTMKLLESYSQQLDSIVDRIHQNTKHMLDNTLNELISQECLIRHDYKVQAAKQVLNCLTKNNQQELTQNLIDFHQGTTELTLGAEQFTNLMNQYQQEINIKFKNILEVLSDLSKQLDDNLKLIFEKQNREQIQAQKQLDQRQVTKFLDNQFKELLESTKNIQIQRINSERILQGNFQFYTNILQRFYKNHEEEEQIEERIISESEWHDIMSRIRQLNSQEQPKKQLSTKYKIRNYSPNNDEKKQKNRNHQLKLCRSVKKFQEFQDISSLLYFPKEQKKNDNFFDQIKELKEKKRLANTFDVELYDQKIENSFQHDSSQRLESEDNILELQIHQQYKYYIIFNKIKTLLDTQRKLVDMQIENLKIDNILKMYFLQLDLKDKVIFKVHRIIDFVVFAKSKIVLGRQDGIIEVWKIRNFLNQKKFERLNVINGQHTSLKYLIQLNAPGLLMTYGQTQEDQKEFSLKIWAFQFNDKLEVIYTVKKLHKGQIQDLIPLEQKQSGLFPNNIYNKEAGSCGAIYFSSFSKNDGVKIWKIYYFGGKISESKISNIINLPIKCCIKMHYKQESIILLSKGQLTKIVFNDLFDKIKDQIVQLIPTNEDYYYHFGQNRIMIGIKKGEIYIFDYELNKISILNFINQFLIKYIDDQQRHINKYQRNYFEVQKKMPKSPQQIIENEQHGFIISDINSINSCGTQQCLINISNYQYLENQQQKQQSRTKERKKIQLKQPYEIFQESVIFDIDNLKIIGIMRSSEVQYFNPNVCRLLSIDEYLVGIDKEQKGIELWEQNSDNEIII